MSLVPLLAANPNRVEARSVTRSPVRLVALLGFDGDQQGRIVVRDLSAEGFRFEAPIELMPAQELRLTIGTRPGLRAEVVYSADGWHGCRFLRHMAPAMLAEIAQAGPFAMELPVATPLPAVHRWPGWVRVSFVLGASGAGWFAVRGVLHVVLG